jgi:hypothetical protein
VLRLIVSGRKKLELQLQRENCTIFKMLTGRAKDSLSNPTAKAFDVAPYLVAMKDNPPTRADLQLIAAATYLGEEIRRLRKVLPSELDALSSSEILRLAIGTSNRTYFIAFQHLSRIRKEKAKENLPGHLSAIGEHEIPAPQSGATVDFISTAVIDSLPHWFAQAAERPNSASRNSLQTPLEYRKIQIRAEQLLTIERGLRDLWQQVLWEPWSFDASKLQIAPENWHHATLWHAWQHRQNALNMQETNLDTVLPLPGSVDTPCNPKAVTAAKWQSGRYKLTIGKPNRSEIRLQTVYMQVLSNSYLAPFLNSSIPNSTLLVVDVVRAWLCLKSLAHSLQREMKDTEYSTRLDLKRLAFEFPSSLIAGALSECMGIDVQTAENIMSFLVCDPTDISDAFAQGLWHRPLVQHPTEKRLMFSAAIVLSADPVYSLERLFRSTELQQNIEKKKSLGLAYEAEVRSSFVQALQKNQILKNTSIAASALPKKDSKGEEIDVLIRVRNLVLVGDVKCFVRPADPIDRFSYLEKLDKAAKQIARKRNWLLSNQEQLRSAFDDPSLNTSDLTFVPIVILNNSAGLGLKIGEALFTDAHWLKLILENGSYASGGKRDYASGTYTEYTTDLYSSEAEFVSKFSNLITECPSLQKFIDGIRWVPSTFPTSTGTNISMPSSKLSDEAMIRGLENAPSTRSRVWPIPTSS